MERDLSYYIKAFSSLRRDRTGKWNRETNFQAPHKPILLLSILDLLAQGNIQINFIELTPELGDLFATYWSRIMPVGSQGNFILPFFHLRSSDFWHLISQPGQEDVLRGLNSISSISQLRKITMGAKLDDELYILLSEEEARNTLRTVLYETYFSLEARKALISQTNLNVQSLIYSQELIDKAKRRISETKITEKDSEQTIRDQGFRKAIVRVYEHRCAFCGVKLITADGHSVVEAAHIIPWSVNHNDNLTNGLALCKLCHWTFDEGLLSVSHKYLVIVSPEVRGTSNMPGLLLTLENRIILTPTDQFFCPGLDSLEWHRENIYRRI